MVERTPIVLAQSLQERLSALTDVEVGLVTRKTTTYQSIITDQEARIEANDERLAQRPRGDLRERGVVGDVLGERRQPVERHAVDRRYAAFSQRVCHAREALGHAVKEETTCRRIMSS